MVNLSIIVLSYNTKELTLKCIQSVVDQFEKEIRNGEIEIVVVDNNSSDGSVETIKKKFMGDSGQARMTQNGNITIFKNKENFGFAKGCNIGAKNAGGKYLLFLNSDTVVLDRGFLKMVDFLDTNNRVGILGGKLLNIDHSPQPSAGKFYTMFNFLLLLIGGERFGWLRSSPEKISATDWVSGACLMISRNLFEKLKGFDEDFFMYMEDMELCFRAKNLGFQTYFYPDLKLVHQSLGSSNREFAVNNIDKGIIYFYRKHKSYWQYLLVKILLAGKGAFRG